MLEKWDTRQPITPKDLCTDNLGPCVDGASTVWGSLGWLSERTRNWSMSTRQYFAATGEKIRILFCPSDYEQMWNNFFDRFRKR